MFFALNPSKAFLSDANEDLINTYIAVRDSPELVIKAIKRLPVNEENYYKVRSKACYKRHTAAAKFIYLNRTSYNGLYRVNRQGEYNVPYGHNDGYCFDYARIRSASNALHGASLMATSFVDTLQYIKKNDLVFLDPPYTVSHNQNGFIEYNKTLFSLEDQKRLRQYIDSLHKRGAYYILTNAAHKTIDDIFSGDNHRIDISRKCLLGGANAKRGDVEEYIFTNIPKELRGI